ncbi:MAG: PhnD/SsuA/transferrin family substrate-binding protein [Chromatiales bacterium]|nr:PhnD/SsuA/transferrin family substrate-binding protein [Chromatiales bacterium]
MRRFWVNLFAGSTILGVLVWNLPVPVASAAEGLLLGVPPYLERSEILQRFHPLADYLAQALGVPVTLRVAAGYDQHLDFTGRDQLDISFVGPAAYLRLARIYGRKPPLASLGNSEGATFRTHIVVATGSDVRSVADLQGRSFAFGHAGAASSHLVPKTMLHDHGLGLADLALHRFLGNQDNVAFGVLCGDFDAGAVSDEVLRKYRDRGLRSLAASDPIPERLLVASQGLPQGTLDRLRTILFDMAGSPAGRQVLAAIQPTATAFVPVRDDVYRRFGLVLQAAGPEDGQ